MVHGAPTVQNPVEIVSTRQIVMLRPGSAPWVVGGARLGPGVIRVITIFFQIDTLVCCGQVCHLPECMSLVMRKPLFGVSDQGRLKPACAATEAS